MTVRAASRRCVSARPTRARVRAGTSGPCGVRAGGRVRLDRAPAIPWLGRVPSQRAWLTRKGRGTFRVKEPGSTGLQPSRRHTPRLRPGRPAGLQPCRTPRLRSPIRRARRAGAAASQPRRAVRARAGPGRVSRSSGPCGRDSAPWLRAPPSPPSWPSAPPPPPPPPPARRGRRRRARARSRRRWGPTCERASKREGGREGGREGEREGGRERGREGESEWRERESES